MHFCLPIYVSEWLLLPDVPKAITAWDIIGLRSLIILTSQYEICWGGVAGCSGMVHIVQVQNPREISLSSLSSSWAKGRYFFLVILWWQHSRLLVPPLWRGPVPAPHLGQAQGLTSHPLSWPPSRPCHRDCMYCASKRSFPVGGLYVI